jgi:hypothetical protein
MDPCPFLARLAAGSKEDADGDRGTVISVTTVAVYFFKKKTGNRDLLLLVYLFTLLLLLGETEQTGSVLFL